jgi:hypothetical protein
MRGGGGKFRAGWKEKKLKAREKKNISERHRLKM